jgi:aminoglycoside/choline kinase family phosphotransferase
VGASEVSGRGEGRHLIERVARRYDYVVDSLLTLPKTLIHGEFYASNVLVHEVDGRCRICPVDWETAAVAPGLLDLAALTCGAWSDNERRAMALAYHARAVLHGSWPARPEPLLAVLELCRLHLAVQWLGWSPNWSPPPEQACNWLTEALCLTEKLGL